jgi:hypothetical protein
MAYCSYVVVMQNTFQILYWSHEMSLAAPPVKLILRQSGYVNFRDIMKNEERHDERQGVAGFNNPLFLPESEDHHNG